LILKAPSFYQDRLGTNTGKAENKHDVSAGAVFDGEGDYLTIEDFNYEDDGDFTISMWITKDDCKSQTEAFEYLYSHVQNTDGDHIQIDDPMNSNINIYVGCEKPGGAGKNCLIGSIYFPLCLCPKPVLAK
jgi:hypothetical protein